MLSVISSVIDVDAPWEIVASDTGDDVTIGGSVLAVVVFDSVAKVVVDVVVVCVVVGLHNGFMQSNLTTRIGFDKFLSTDTIRSNAAVTQM